MNKLTAILFSSLLVVFIAGPLHACSKTYPHAEGYDEDIAEIVEMIDEARNSNPIYLWDSNTKLDYFRPWFGQDGTIIRKMTTMELKSSEVINGKLYLGFHTVDTNYSNGNEVSNNTDFITVELEKTDAGWEITDIENHA